MMSSPNTSTQQNAPLTAIVHQMIENASIDYANTMVVTPTLVRFYYC